MGNNLLYCIAITLSNIAIFLIVRTINNYKNTFKQIALEIIKNLKEEQQERRDNLMLVYTEYLIDDYETEEMKTIHWSVNGIDKKLGKLISLEERLEKL